MKTLLVILTLALAPLAHAREDMRRSLVTKETAPSPDKGDTRRTGIQPPGPIFQFFLQLLFGI